jgi:mRNA interferase HigB
VLRVISKRELFNKSEAFADAKTPLQVWLEIAKQAKWNSLEDIRKALPATDMIGKLAIFNIKGNTYRLLARIEFDGQRIYVKEFLTHAEYSKGRGKNGCDRQCILW